MQIALKLGMDVLGIPVKAENYRQICDVLYLAEKSGVHISPGRIILDPITRHAHAPALRSGWPDCYYPTFSLQFEEIERELNLGRDDSEGWCLDENSTKKLEELKRLISLHGIENLLKGTSQKN